MTSFNKELANRTWILQLEIQEKPTEIRIELHELQLKSTVDTIPQPAQPSNDQLISSVLQSNPDINNKKRKRVASIHPDVLREASLENFDG